MSSAGHVLDMIKRIRQNRSLRPSNRQKFKGDNRDSIYTEIPEENKASFKEFPESQVKEVVDTIRREAKSKRRKEFLFLALVILIVVAIVLYVV
ncbi:hypothetical protein [Ulvibacterium marinum]|uniref:Uncharacterized protein n=1 Tax=Ulvibacterium marinum TaxID=2419782 RepID=A0A3B0CBV9_9FLAO|nr:hypothetical protein [Ulvibacterium marinum]RKN82420.1 hypothetical protein D7Z94_00770 [Ulvibacterium marinum]